MFILKHELKLSVSIFSWFLISELPSVVSPIPFDNDDEDCDDGDFELESFSDEILDDYQMRAYGKYQELDFYMERIVEIQEQLSLANHWFFIRITWSLIRIPYLIIELGSENGHSKTGCSITICTYCKPILMPNCSSDKPSCLCQNKQISENIKLWLTNCGEKIP